MLNFKKNSLKKHAKFAFIALAFFLNSNSFAGNIGMVKICALNDADKVNDGILSIAAGDYFSGEEENSGMSINVSQFKYDKNNKGCLTGYAVISGNPNHDPIPSIGFKWHKSAQVSGFQKVTENSRYYEKKINTEIKLEAELIDKFVQSSGKIKICRMLGITELRDGKEVDIPANTYTGACDKTGQNCRVFIFKAEATKLDKSKSACSVVNAELIKPDGTPIHVGDPIRPQFSIAGLTLSIKAASEFK